MHELHFQHCTLTTCFKGTTMADKTNKPSQSKLWTQQYEGYSLGIHVFLTAIVVYMVFTLKDDYGCYPMLQRNIYAIREIYCKE